MSVHETENLKRLVDYINVSFLGTLLYYSHARCYHCGETWAKVI